jgi:DNA-directed RNA polymerase subunit RPC12/RpoP
MIIMTIDEYQMADDEMEGRCTACGMEAYGVEPDARRYTCEYCEARAVYGVQELMLMGQIDLVIP